ncbi:hypothetical protein [Micromonospora echinofusca]|uniref:Alpha/beta hydrolase family protein n=1 Tax=Micromonospora echinofusca TaxID=47858 RepID=A0ABS3VQE0_MICEH|nr:hypothetical protein [Micromonospora echinofusca]MBO4206761.1 hypothetical protein [Micromonospora echinofusca]
MIRAMRHDAQAAEDYSTDLLHRRVDPLRAPAVSVVGERDPGTGYHQERYRGWGFRTGTTALVLIEEAGHHVVRFPAAEVADILTGVDRRLTGRRRIRVDPAPGRCPSAGSGG